VPVTKSWGSAALSSPTVTVPTVYFHCTESYIISETMNTAFEYKFVRLYSTHACVSSLLTDLEEGILRLRRSVVNL